MILEKDLTKELLTQEIDHLLSDENNLKNMAEKSKNMGRPEATSLLVDEMENLLKGVRKLACAAETSLPHSSICSSSGTKPSKT